MSKAKAYLAYPVYDRPVMKSILARDVAMRNAQTVEVHPFMWMGDSLISRVRNRNINQFLRTPEFDWYMTLDCDIEVLNREPGDNVFDKMVAWGKDFVGALVSKTNIGPGVKPLASVPMVNGPIRQDSGLVEMRWLGAGLTCISRACVQKMADAYPQLKYTGTDMCAGFDEYALYMPYIAEQVGGYRKMMSEDWAICQRWRDIGGQIWADTSLRTRHWGEYGWTIWPDDQLDEKRVEG